MEAITVDSLFDIPDKYFKFFGFSIINQPNSPMILKKISRGGRLSLFFVYITVIIFLVTSNFINLLLCPEERSHSKIIYFVNVPVTITEVLTIFFSRKYITSLTSDFREIFKSSIIEEHQCKGLRIFTKTFRTVCYGTILVFIIRIIRTVFTNGVDTIGLDSLWTPINNALVVNFILTYIGILNAIMLFASEVTIETIITLLSISFDHLTVKIQLMNYVDKDRKMKKIIEIIQHQSKLFAISEKVENHFSLLFFVFFIRSSIGMCLAGFEIMTLSDISNIVLHTFFLLIVSTQIFSICYFGQKVIISSQNAAQAAYESNWYEIRDVQFKKALLLLILRSQKQQQLTAKRFVPLSLETFTHVSTFIQEILI